MIALSLAEAQLFRILSDIFGQDRVVPHMSVVAACGGELPQTVVRQIPQIELWARKNKCLFTIVDQHDAPKLVVEFFSGFEEAVDPTEEEHHRMLTPLLPAAGVHYVTISQSEFSEIIDPNGGLDIFTLFRAKMGLEDGSEAL